MEPNSDQSANPGFLRKYQGSLIIAAIVVVAIVIFVANRNGGPENQNENEQTNEQTDNTDQNEDQDNLRQNGSTDNDGSAQSTGNVTAKGILMSSDDPIRGNLMLTSEASKIYIATVRDFSVLLQKQVTLQAEGDINNFKFLGFAEGQGLVSGTDTQAVGGGDTLPVADVRFEGTFRTSDNVDRGNYMIVSGSTKVWLISVRDYSPLLGMEAVLTATGTIDSFTNATVVKK
ncbi:MAG: hypothetical protein A2660_00490 [Candidatus Doudnabacteria bacterium RIFCSPHIGHO2_01_FULL_45_18]|uniref:Uncharacterized protein n=1 Tax=Candidatus Doudnabacteria bacterium RIFCSPHIGHO2_01_FULL_45_18 TaxID=1817823 RepID=A0A1F5NQL8_9BACT|nr:MAG: hypothetical protein A2660_00490 [Candidatus Doudnabacteria bacterium RIFCSPHIGHO2_01_FULL_45_18]